MTSTSKNYLIAFLTCTTLAGAGLALQQRQLLAEAKAAPTLKITQSNFAPRPAQALSDPKPSSPPRAADTEEAAPSAAAADTAGVAPNTPGQGRGQWGARMAELMKDPEFVSALKVEQESRIENRYGALFKQLNLPADKIAALKNLLIERENARRDVMASAIAQKLDPRDPDTRTQLRTLTEQLEAEVDTNIKTAIGDIAYTQLETYKATQPQRSTVSNFNEKLALSGQPLSDSQAQQLTRILSETGTVNGRNVTITDQTISVARGVLMPAQVETLIKYQAQKAAEKIIESKTRGSFSGGGPPRGN
jgi:hypothetical protein